MLLVRTHVAASPISGVGLFASDPISKHTVVWEFCPVMKLPPGVVDGLSTVARDFVKRSGGQITPDEWWTLCGDNARFINHSEEPNVGRTSDRLVNLALRDISAGEELTEDYRVVSLDFQRRGFYRGC